MGNVRHTIFLLIALAVAALGATFEPDSVYVACKTGSADSVTFTVRLFSPDPNFFLRQTDHRVYIQAHRQLETQR